MTSWGLVTTLRAPKALVMAFVDHHLALGAARLWLYFDDPDDPAYDAVAALPCISATRCGPDHWEKITKRRPDKVENRQSRNAQDAYAGCPLPWIGHVDVDEFIWPARPVSAFLDAVPQTEPMLRMEPFEAMHDLAQPDGPPRAFRGALKARHADLRPAILGRYAETLPEGMLSHSVGKAFFRTGIPGLSLRLHGAFRDGARVPGPPFTPGIALLHCHAQDLSTWQAALAFRLTQGAYQYQPALQAFLQSAEAAEIARFYTETQTLTPEKEALLIGAKRLILADLAHPPRGAGPQDQA
jgi:Glycosyl transferase family 2